MLLLQALRRQACSPQLCSRQQPTLLLLVVMLVLVTAARSKQQACTSCHRCRRCQTCHCECSLHERGRQVEMVGCVSLHRSIAGLLVLAVSSLKIDGCDPPQGCLLLTVSDYVLLISACPVAVLLLL